LAFFINNRSTQALVHSRLDETFESINRSTYGISFFGTPHQGGKHASVGDIGATILRGILRNPSNSFMSTLQKGSVFSEAMRDFRYLADSYQYVSFYETRPVKPLGLVNTSPAHTSLFELNITDSTRSLIRIPLLSVSVASAKNKLLSMQTIERCAVMRLFMMATTSKLKTTLWSWHKMLCWHKTMAPLRRIRQPKASPFGNPAWHSTSPKSVALRHYDGFQEFSTHSITNSYLLSAWKGPATGYLTINSWISGEMRQNPLFSGSMEYVR
jgi:hypothetical protein